MFIGCWQTMGQIESVTNNDEAVHEDETSKKLSENQVPNIGLGSAYYPTLYSHKRWNLTTSRSQCVCILVANPKFPEQECHTVNQIKLANGLCRLGIWLILFYKYYSLVWIQLFCEEL